ncbi:MAG TPA: hypothetical protein VI756_02085 [Blastocatellia bacterium]
MGGRADSPMVVMNTQKSWFSILTNERISEGRRLPLKALVRSLFVLPALVPIVRMTWILSAFGCNNASNDEVQLISSFLGPAMAGKYNWLHLPRDTFSNTHSDLIPGLIYFVMAHVARLNAFALLYLAVAFDVVALCLLYASFARASEGSPWVTRALFALLLSGLIFSVTQMSAFEFPLLSIKTSLNQLGLAIGIWGLTRFQHRWPGLTLALAGGLIASLSNATGIAMWPVILLGMILLGFRQVRFFLAWVAAVLISVAPYALFVFVDRTSPNQSTFNSVFRPVFFVNMLGGALNPDGRWWQTGAAPLLHFTGILGLVLLVSGMAFLLIKPRRELFERSAPALMLITFGLLCILEISAFRGGLAPWYTPWSIDFWIGLVGLIYVLWGSNRKIVGRLRADRPRSIAIGGMFVTPALTWALVCAVAIGWLVLLANLTHSDKSFYIASRSPVAATCLRNYRTAPTYCENRLVQWMPGNPDYMRELAEPLERNGLSVFAPSQEWTLQGDTYLGRVSYHQEPAVPRIIWTADTTPVQSSPESYAHLNLFVHSPNWVSWRVLLPASLESAELRSAVTISSAAPRGPVADGVTAQVYIRQDGADEQLVYSKYLSPNSRSWRSFSIPVLQYAGKTITIRLGSDPGANIVHDWLLYEYPRIDLTTRNAASDPPQIQPSNTDLSPDLPKMTSNDFDLRMDKWQPTDLQPISSEEGLPKWKVVGRRAALEYDFSEPVETADYSHLLIKVSLEAPPLERSISIWYSDASDPGFSPGRSFTLPLLADKGLHYYSYDLSLPPSFPKSLKGLIIRPVYDPGAPEDSIEIADVRLVHKPDKDSSGN